jgi:VIT1/CCC1 family predicted Fe2+/Mn2+ transporter
VVEHLTADQDRWLHAMMADEHGMVEEETGHALIDGLKIGAAFVIGGLVPLLPFVIPVPHPQIAAYLLTGATVLTFGAVKARYTSKGALRSSLEFLIIVTAGSIAGVLVGHLLHSA